MNTPTKTAREVVVIEPLVKIEPVTKIHPMLDGIDNAVMVYEATCKVCGPLNPLNNYPGMAHANMLRQRHLAEHLTALAAEVADASR